MTAATDQFVDIAKQSQEAVTTAFRTWAETVQGLTSGFTGGQPKLPDVHAILDKYFDFAQQVLDNQRRLAQTLLTASTQAAETVTEQATRAAQSVTARATNAGQATAEKVDQTARVAGEATAANRAAKSAAVKS
jgi:hypothetical protein